MLTRRGVPRRARNLKLLLLLREEGRKRRPPSNFSLLQPSVIRTHWKVGWCSCSKSRWGERRRGKGRITIEGGEQERHNAGVRCGAAGRLGSFHTVRPHRVRPRPYREFIVFNRLRVSPHGVAVRTRSKNDRGTARVFVTRGARSLARATTRSEPRWPRTTH